MELFKNETYQNKENVEALFKKLGYFGEEYNDYFGASVPPSVLSVTLLAMGGALGGLVEAKRQENKLTGFLVNSYEKGICLIPLYVDSKANSYMDMEGIISLHKEEIESVSIKFADISWKKVTITLKDERKFVMHVIKKNKAFLWHKDNFQHFMDMYKG